MKAGLPLIGIFLGVLLLIVAIPHIDTLHEGVVDAGVAAPIPAIFVIVLVLCGIAAIVALVLALAREH